MPKTTSSNLVNAKLMIKIVSILGIVIFLFWFRSWASPNLISLSSTVTSTQTPTVLPTATSILYIYQEGDTLAYISEKYNLGLDGPWLIYYANRTVIERYDGAFFPGQSIIIPPPGSVVPTHTPVPADLPSGTMIKHRVLPGDQLENIIIRYNTTREGIIAANPDIAENPDVLTVWQILQIPVNLETVTATVLP